LTAHTSTARIATQEAVEVIAESISGRKKGGEEGVSQDDFLEPHL
jgi:hypothetical protein